MFDVGIGFNLYRAFIIEMIESVRDTESQRTWGALCTRDPCLCDSVELCLFIIGDRTDGDMYCTADSTSQDAWIGGDSRN